MVSVIIPNYNHSKYLNQRIESVLNQTFQDFEVIILDDCSADNSREIIEIYRQHPKVKEIIYNELNSGSTFKQWNKGIELASGDYIWIAESDDYSDPNFLKVMINKFYSIDNLVLSYCRTINVDSSNNFISINNWPDTLDKVKWKSDFVTNGISEIQTSFIFKNIIPNASSVVFKKDSIQNFDFNEMSKFKYCGDWYFWLHIFSKGEVSYSNIKLNYQRHHIGSSTKMKNITEEIKRFKEYFICITKASDFTSNSINYLNFNYDWIFEQIRGRISFNLRVFFIFAFCSRSFSVLYRCLQIFTK